MADGSLIFDTKVDTDGFQNGLGKLRSAADKFAKVTEKGLGAVKIASGGIANVGQFGIRIFNGLTKAVAGVSLAVTAFGVSAINTGKDFEMQMSRVQAISGGTASEMEALNEQAVKLGAETSFSAKDAAQGMENLASAGFKNAEIMRAMPGLLDLAAISGRDVGMSTENAATALRAFNLDASAAGHVADVYAKAAADTNAEVSDMGYAMKYIGPIARSLGFSLEETAAAIGLMSDKGIKGTQAGTTLRAAFTRLTKPTKQMQKVMEEWNLSFFDAEGNMKGMSEVIGEFSSKLSNATNQQKTEAAAVLFGTEALSGMLALMETGPQKLNDMTSALKNSSGAAQDMARTMQNNLGSELEQFGGAMETFKISIFRSVRNPLVETTKTGIEFVNSLTKAFETGGLTGLVTQFGNVLSEVILKTTESLPGIMGVGLNIINQLTDSLTSNMPVFVSGIQKLGGVLIEAFTSVYPSLINLGFELVSKISESIADGLPAVLPGITGAFNKIAESVKRSFPVITNNIQTIIKEILPVIITTFAEIMPVIVKSGADILDSLLWGLYQNTGKITPAIQSVLNTIIKTVTNSAPLIVSMIGSLIPVIITAITDNIPAVTNTMQQMMFQVVSIIQDNLPLILSSAMTIIQTLGEGLISAIPDLIPDILQIIVTFSDFIIANLPAIVDLGIQLISALATGLIEQLPYLIENIPRLINSFADTFNNQLPKILGLGVNLIVSLLKGIINSVPAILQNIPAIVMAIINAFSLSNFFNLGKDLILSIGNGIKNLGPNLLKWIHEVIDTAWTGIKNWITGSQINVSTFLVDTLKGIFGGIIGIGDFVLNIAKNIGSNLLTGIWNGIIGTKDWLFNNVSSVFSNFVSNIKDFFGIHSPSTLMEEEIGANLPPGIALGVDAEMPDLKKNVDAQLNDLTAQMQKTVEGEMTVTGKNIAANSNIYLPSGFDKIRNGKGETAMLTSNNELRVDLDGRTVGRTTSKYTSEEMVLNQKRRGY